MRVVDASVAVKWFVQEADTGVAMGLLNDPDAVIAPDLVVAEVVSI
jgi:predicted nucleic acid-binding protein